MSDVQSVDAAISHFPVQFCFEVTFLRDYKMHSFSGIWRVGLLDQISLVKQKEAEK